jgi:hypothetical protein
VASESAFVLPDYARMPMEPGFYVSVDATVLADAGGAAIAQDACCADRLAATCTAAASARAFVRTVRGAYVPSGALATVTAPPAPGTRLDGALGLPLGIVYRGSARHLERDAASGAFQELERLARFAHVPLTGAQVRNEGVDYLQTRSGALVSALHLRVARRVPRPPLVPRRARWIHVHLAEQTLVAYEGDRPVFATLVATGKEGFGTPPGLFRIHAKHVSATMDGLAGSDDVYSIEDVPWTMYFQGSYALHAAFWHDRLGAPRSHGCVNLACWRPTATLARTCSSTDPRAGAAQAAGLLVAEHLVDQPAYRRDVERLVDARVVHLAQEAFGLGQEGAAGHEREARCELRTRLAHVVEQVHAGLARHDQVAQDDVEALARLEAPARLGRASERDHVVVLAQRDRQRLGDRALVVDHQHAPAPQRRAHRQRSRLERALLAAVER